MHPLYLNDFLTQLISNNNSDMEFLTQGLHGVYNAVSKKDSIALQQFMAEVSRQAVFYRDSLQQLENELEKIHKKNDY